MPQQDARGTGDSPRADPVVRAIEEGKIDEALSLVKGRPRGGQEFGIMKVVEALVEQGQTERALDIFKSEVQLTLADLTLLGICKECHFTGIQGDCGYLG